MTKFEKNIFKFLITFFGIVMYSLTQYRGTIPVQLDETQTIGLFIIAIVTYIFSIVVVNEMSKK